MRGSRHDLTGGSFSRACPLILSCTTLKPSDTPTPPTPELPDRPPGRPHEWVQTPGQLERLSSHLASQPLAGIDTESDSFHHYRERVCLIQISTAEIDAIIDPLVLTDLAAMRPLFSDPSRIWVM